MTPEDGPPPPEPPEAPELPTRDGISATEATIRAYVRWTPVVTIDGRDLGVAGSVTLKLESLQHAGSFKARGAFSNLLLRDIPAAGVVAASGGNHGVAVAYAARRVGVPAAVFVPEISSPAKLARIRDYGANLMVTGARYADALAASREYEAATGALSVHAFDSPYTVMGAGTLAFELEAQAPEAGTVVTSVGGGGLLGGTAAWFGDRRRIVGVEPEGAPTLTRARAAGRPVDAPADGIAADSLAPRQVGRLAFALAERYVDEVVLVADDAIRQAQQVLWDEVRVVAEPGGAAALAAVLSGRVGPAGGHTAVVVSGANTTAVDFGR